MTAPGGGGTFGSAYVDFHARTEGLEQDLRDAFDRTKKDADAATKDAGNAYGRAFFDNMSDVLPGETPKFADHVTREFKKKKFKVKVDVDLDVDRGTIAQGARKVASSFFSSLTGGLGSLGASVGNVGSKGPFAPFIGGLILAVIPAIVGAVAALLNVFLPLVNAVFLLPAGLSVLAASIIPVTVAFQGFGDAVGAILSGDPEKINEALKGLSASARDVAKDFQGVLPWLHQFKLLTQEAFFRPLTDAIPRLQKALGPTFLTGFQQVAAAAGGFAASLVKVAENPSVQEFFQDVFNVAAATIEGLTPAFSTLLIGLADLGRATLPTILELADFLAKLLQDLGTFLSDIVASGEINLFMSELKDALHDLFELIASGWNLAKAIIGGVGEEDNANQFLDLIIYTIDAMTDFFSSGIGQEALKGMIILAGAFVIALGGVVIAFGLISAAVAAIADAIIFVISLVERLLQLLGLVSEASIRARATAPGQGGRGAPISGTIGRIVGRARRRGLQEGGIISDPGWRFLGEGYRPEVVIPLTDQARARELADRSGLTSMLGGGGITFGANAIQVNFHGNVPSQEEAYRTGAAVGNGISDLLARRNTRLAVRTL
jgi:hypothetical protein